MQVLKMNAEQIRQFVRTLMGRHLRNVPAIALPLPSARYAESENEPNWNMDLSQNDWAGYEDLLQVVVAQAQQSVLLVGDASELAPPPKTASSPVLRLRGPRGSGPPDKYPGA